MTPDFPNSANKEATMASQPINMASVAAELERKSADLANQFDASCKAISEGISRRDATISALSRALRDLLELVETHGLEPCRDFEPYEFEAIVDGAVQDSRRALAMVEA